MLGPNIQHFPGGGTNFFEGGGVSNCLFPKETHITCDFPGVGACPRLDPRMYGVEIEKKDN